MNKIDIAVISKAKQGYIYKYMMDNKLSAMALSEKIGISYRTMIHVLNFNWLPPTKKLKRNSVKEKLENYFKLPIDYLFPPEITRQIAERLSRPVVKMYEIETIQLSQASVKYLKYEPEEGEHEADDGITKALGRLTQTEQDVIERRFGLNGSEGGSLGDVAAVRGVTRERIRQIESKALRKLRHPSISKSLAPLYLKNS